MAWGPVGFGEGDHALAVGWGSRVFIRLWCATVCLELGASYHVGGANCRAATQVLASGRLATDQQSEMLFLGLSYWCCQEAAGGQEHQRYGIGLLKCVCCRLV